MSNVSANHWLSRFILRAGQFVGGCLLLAALVQLKPVVAYLADAIQMRSWEPTPATILSAEYRQIEGNAGPQALVKYRYTHNGVEHQGTRADLAQASELIGSFQQKLVTELAPHPNRPPITCYVNPRRPEESVIDRRFYYTVFAFRLGRFLALALAGTALVAWGTLVLRRNNRHALRQKQHPHEPWLWRDDWAANDILSESKTNTRTVVVLSAVYVLLVFPLGLMILREWEQPIFSVPGVVLILIAWAAFNLARLRIQKGRGIDSAKFRMAAVPGVIGGPVAGVVEIPTGKHRDARFRVVLECIQCQRVPDGDGDHNEWDVRWRDSVAVQNTLSIADSNVTAVPVYFAIPFESEPSDPSVNPQLKWRLKVGLDREPFDHYALFEVPVFRTPASSRKFLPNQQVMEPYLAPVTADEVLKQISYQSRPLPEGGEELRFSVFKWWLVGGGIVILGICGAIIAAIAYFHLHFLWMALPGGFGLLVLFAALETLVWGCTLRIHSDTLTITTGYRGVRRTHQVARDDIESVQAVVEFSMKEKDFFAIRLTTAKDERFTLIKRIEGRQPADVVAEWLRTKLIPLDARSESPKLREAAANVPRESAAEHPLA